MTPVARVGSGRGSAIEVRIQVARMGTKATPLVGEGSIAEGGEQSGEARTRAGRPRAKAPSRLWRRQWAEAHF